MGALILINDKNNIKLRFKITNLITSGLVMIDINNAIKSDYDLFNFTKDFKKISLGGIFFNIILIFIGVCMMVFKVTIDIGFIMIIINIATIAACFLPKGYIFRVIELNKEPNKISTYFIEELVINNEINEYCKNSIYSYVESMLISRKYNVYLLNSLVKILEYIIINNESIPGEINRFVNWFIFNYNKIKNTKNFYIRIAADKLIYLIINYNLIDKNLLEKLNIEEYKKKIIKHPLNKVYNEFESYRNNKLILKNIKKSNMFNISIKR